MSHAGRLQPCRTLSVSIDCPPARVYAFVRNAENLPRWIAFIRSVRHEIGEWIAETSEGVMRFTFVADNDLGVLDHRVTVAPGVEFLNPMRVIANGSGSEVSFTLFQLPGTTTEKFDEDTGLVQRDSTGAAVVATKVPGRYTTDLLRARRLQREDWIAALFFNHVIAGAEAFVSAHLWDVPAAVSLSADGRGGATVVASLRW